MGILNDIHRRGLARQRRGIHQCGQPPSTGIGIDSGQGSVGIGDSEQVIKQQQVLRLRVGKLSPYPRSGGIGVNTLDAGDRTQQPCHGMEGDLAGV
jgi:hypothetical protein